MSDTDDDFGQPKKEEVEETLTPIEESPNPEPPEPDPEPDTSEPDPYEGIFPDKSAEDLMESFRNAEPSIPEEGPEAWESEDNKAMDVSGEQQELIKAPEIMDPQRRDPKKALHLPILPYMKIWAWDIDRNFRRFTVHGIFSSSVSSSSSSSSPSSSASPSPGSNGPSSAGPPSSKMAIVPVKVNGVEKNIGWFCAEEPEARFFDTLEIPVPRFTRRVSVSLPQEFRQSVEPDIQVISAHSPEVPACVSGVYKNGQVYIKFQKPFFSRPIGKVIVRIQGRRKDGPERWKRFSTEVMERNNAFWAQAYGG